MRKLYKNLGNDIGSLLIFIIVVILAIKIVLWALHIHWLFGLLMLLIIGSF